MAQISGGNSLGIRMDLVKIADLFDGDVITRSSSQLRIDIGSGYIESFTGTGFSFNSNGAPVAGTITGISETLNGAVSFTVTGLSTSAAQFYSFVPANDTQLALNLLFIGDDDMHGTALPDAMSGYAGHDNLFGGNGADTLLGGPGNDHIYGQSPNGGSDGNDILVGEGGSDYLQGNAGNDSIDGGDGSDRLQGGRDDDVLVGGTGNDSINGNLGNDSISGDADSDFLRGGQGNDTISGGSGNDQIQGDLGVDRLTGGSGADSFVFGGAAALFAGASADVVTDFQDGIDVLKVGYLPLVVLTGSSANFANAATLAQQLFDGHIGTSEAAAIKVGSDTFLFYSSNNGGSADSAVQLSGIDNSAITVADFA